MKVSFAALLLAISATGLAMADAQKSVVVSYPADTPNSVIEQAMDAIKAAGGIITHQYNVIKGFAATASEQALATVQTLGQQSNVVIEEDQLVGVGK